MKKVGLFKSIHLKFILIYILLILLAMQVIGVYFVRQLEEQLVSNFTESIKERTQLLAYNIEQEMISAIEENNPNIQENVYEILQDFRSEDIYEVQVIDNNSIVLGTSDQNNQIIVGKRTNEPLVKYSLAIGTETEKTMRDPISGNRMYVVTVPIINQDETIGFIYLVASMEKVYTQMEEINNILAAGTGIALLITAILGIFLARMITRPLADMRKQALVIAEGDFSGNVKVYGDDEIGQLAMTFNTMTRKLESAQALTEEERHKLSSVLAHMTDGVIAANKEGDIILLNHAAEQMLNVSRETVLGKSLINILKLDGTASISSLISNPVSRIVDMGLGKEPFLIKTSFSIIQMDSGQPNGIIAVLQDVTEQERTEKERREFVANVSHELRTPLTTMRSYLEALTDGAWEDKNIAPKFLNVTQNETERMIRLVNDLLQLSKLDNKDYQFDKQVVNFTEYYHQVIDRFEMFKEQNVTFLRDFSEEIFFVYVDRDKITQILDNIISNALKYSPEGGVITFNLERVQENMLEVKVSDQGVGIPKEMVSKIFDRFYRVDKARTRKLGGTGLGLAIAKELIEAHGGSIMAESIEGQGTTIKFVLPLVSEREVYNDE